MSIGDVDESKYWQAAVPDTRPIEARLLKTGNKFYFEEPTFLKKKEPIWVVNIKKLGKDKLLINGEFRISTAKIVWRIKRQGVKQLAITGITYIKKSKQEKRGKFKFRRKDVSKLDLKK